MDFFIVATDRQKEVLAAQFAKYTQHSPAIYTIPVGSLESLPQKDSRKPFSLMTASRLATEKHIDWLIRAVVEAKKELPALSFDIYGKGGEEEKLRSLIEELGATDYIQLKGHMDLTAIYKDYEVYLSASTSEGFGLTLMEAIGSGLPIIGFDVPYGNQNFVRDGENGYLLPTEPDQVVDRIARSFAEMIRLLYQSKKMASMRQASYARAEDFLTSKVEKAWSQLIEEVTHA